MCRFNVDTSNIDKNLDWQYSIEIENEQIKWFSPEFLKKFDKLKFAERSIEIITQWQQDKNWNIVWWWFETIWKIKAWDYSAAKKVQENIRITYK